MSERGIHYITADLAESWLRDWTAVGLFELEHYLAKYAAFVAYLAEREAVTAPSPATS
jgi:hypothetical protein